MPHHAIMHAALNRRVHPGVELVAVSLNLLRRQKLPKNQESKRLEVVDLLLGDLHNPSSLMSSAALHSSKRRLPKNAPLLTAPIVLAITNHVNQLDHGVL